MNVKTGRGMHGAARKGFGVANGFTKDISACGPAWFSARIIHMCVIVFQCTNVINVIIVIIVKSIPRNVK